MTGSARIVSPVAYFPHERAAALTGIARPNEGSRSQSSLLTVGTQLALRLRVLSLIGKAVCASTLSICGLKHFIAAGQAWKDKKSFLSRASRFKLESDKRIALVEGKPAAASYSAGVDLRCADRSPAFLAGSSNYRLPSTASSQLAYRDEAA